MRRHLLSIVCFLAAGLIGVVAIADHGYKTRRIDRAEIASWYCAHDGSRCGGPSPYVMERRWNQRQLAYEAAVGVLGGLAIVRFAVRAIRR
jgi:hypothetical protein